MTPETRLFIRGILHGMTGAGLFHRVSYRDPDQEFIDSRPLQEVIDSGDFGRTLSAVVGATRHLPERTRTR